MRDKIIKIGCLLAVASAGIFSTGAARAEPNFSQAGAVCKVTKRGGTTIFVNALSKDFPIRRGGTMIVVDPEPHQGLIAVRAMVNRKMRRGEIKIEDTNCVPILPR